MASDRVDDISAVVLDHDTGDVVGTYQRRPTLLGRAIGAGLVLVALGRKAVELPQVIVGTESDPISGDGPAPIAIQDKFGDIPTDGEDLRAAFPSATDRVVVFVGAPGTGAASWDRGSQATGASYGERLAMLLGWTPVWLRHDADTDSRQAQVALASVLQQLVDAWPVQISRIAIVAEGDGGLLVRRSAAMQALTPRPWTGLVSDVVLLGTKAFAAGSRPTTGPFGRRIDADLGGIAPMAEGVAVSPLTADYVLISDRPAPRPTALGQLLGNLLWLRHRLGPPVVELFPTATRIEVSSGPDLINHPEVHSGLLHWLR